MEPTESGRYEKHLIGVLEEHQGRIAKLESDDGGIRHAFSELGDHAEKLDQAQRITSDHAHRLVDLEARIAKLTARVDSLERLTKVGRWLVGGAGAAGLALGMLIVSCLGSDDDVAEECEAVAEDREDDLEDCLSRLADRTDSFVACNDELERTRDDLESTRDDLESARDTLDEATKACRELSEDHRLDEPYACRRSRY